MALLESDLQQAIFSWAATMEKKYPELNTKLFHAVPNGGRRDAREAAGLKLQGVKAGVLDIALDVARGGYHGLKMELKIPGGKCKKASKEQLEYIAFCEQQGYICLVSNDFKECKKFIGDYLDGVLVRE